MMSSSGSVNESDCPISRCVASSQPVVQSVADVVMSDLEARTRSAASKVLEEYQEVMQLALTKTSLDEKWTVFEPALEKLAQAKNFELFIDLLVNIKLHDPLVELSPSLKAYLCTDFRLNPEHPLRAVYVLMNQVPGPTFFQVMKSTDLPFPEKIPLRESDSSWTFLDESQDSTGVIHWLNVQVEAALNAPHRRYDTPQSWIDIALFNLCRRTQFLPFHMQIQGRGESACLHHVFVVLYFRLSHLKLKDIKNDLDRFNNQESCREVMEAAPFFITLIKYLILFRSYRF